ncbi:MAG: malto-oligosyltrehalose synthase [Gemmataceae bacterium]|nr:malto-oligosyltrehalose synthase [Gemmataceae bacterium]
MPRAHLGDAMTIDDLGRARRVPLATYRFQLNAGLPFASVAGLLDYLHDLGIRDVYLSPILQARPGSLHGYDACDHSRVNPELGGLPGLEALAAALAARGMGALLDVVPNHMGIGHPSNRWWWDVLENGQASRHADHFDIDWKPVNPDLAGKVLLPVLGKQYGEALEAGELRLVHERGGFSLAYFQHRFPVSPRSARLVLASRLDHLAKRLGETEAMQEYRSVVRSLELLPLDPHGRETREREAAVARRRLAALADATPEAREEIEEAVKLFNGAPGDPASFDALDGLLAEQPYRLAYWQVAADEINYRRFFDVNDLAAIRTEVPEVFDAVHRIPLELLAAGHVHGLRIDHPDGLHSPAGYFRQLQEAYVRARGIEGKPTGPPWPLYVLAEKILGEGETLTREWALDGTTGYDFMTALNGLFIAPESIARLDEAYSAFCGPPPPFASLVRKCKLRMMEGAMASEAASLAHQLDRLAERSRRYRDFTLSAIAEALRELIASLAVYRTYTDTEGGASPRDRAVIEHAVADARAAAPALADALFDFLRDTVLLDNLAQFPADDAERVREWVLRFQQITGPIMAKGIEDTAFYLYNRLVSLNEVGGHPHAPCVPLEKFHELGRARAAEWPLSMLSTSTHDTKRSEDVRARINVLAEIPDEWAAAVMEWRWINGPLVRDGMPSANDQYLFYQTLLGVWPEEADLPGLKQRLVDYMAKATKEAKEHTGWVNPEPAYDDAVRAFVEGVLAHGPDSPFMRSFLPLQEKVARFGRMNGLAQVLLKLAGPGVPDIYQGTEMWDLSLVDPDNRRPVDYERRRAALESVRSVDPRELMEHAADGRVKLWLTQRLLAHRNAHPALYRGEYEGVMAEGEHAEAACAFVRRSGEDWALAAACIRPVRVSGGWGDTSLPVPQGRLRNVLTGEEVPAHEGRVRAADLFAVLPVALLER